MNPAPDTVPKTSEAVNFSESDLKRFWAKVDKNGPIPIHKPELGPCWIWTGKPDRNGYGQFSFDGNKMKVHRVSYLICIGKIPPSDDNTFHGTCVCHHCDVRNCVNPNHFFLGTHSKNILDMWQKGRHSKRPKTIKVWVPKTRSLTKENVIEIRAIHTAGGVRLKDIALKFGVDVSLVSLIVNRKRWKEI